MPRAGRYIRLNKFPLRASFQILLLTTTVTMVAGATSTIKFLCSYDGKILPRRRDGKLRYVGGHTRVLAVDRSISFSELMLKLGDLCGSTVILRCQLPSEDLDALVSVKSDEDLAHVIEEYDRAGSKLVKIRGFLSSPRSGNKQSLSPPPSDSSSPKSHSPRSSSSSGSFSSTSAFGSNSDQSRFPAQLTVTPMDRCIHHSPAPVMAFPVRSPRNNVARYGYNHHGNSSNMYLVHNRNQCQ